MWGDRRIGTNPIDLPAAGTVEEIAPPATEREPRSLIPAPLSTLLTFVAFAGGLTLLAMAWPLVAALAVLAVEWVLR